MTSAVAFRPNHLDDLTPPSDQLGKQACRRVRKLPKLWFGSFSKVCDHGGIDQIGLGALAKNLCEGPPRRRIDPPPRQASAGKPRRNHRLETPGSLNRHQPDREVLQPFDQLIDPGTRAANRKTTSLRPYRYVQPLLRYIDTDINRVHLIPSLRKRASQAAQATVRVQWNGRRRPSLSHGLGVPQVARSPACHRNAYPTRVGYVQVTRERTSDDKTPP